MPRERDPIWIEWEKTLSVLEHPRLARNDDLNMEIDRYPFVHAPQPWREIHKDPTMVTINGHTKAVTPICMFVEQPVPEDMIRHTKFSCHHCRMAQAAHLANVGHTMMRVSDDTNTVGLEPGVYPSSMILQRICEHYDDVALLKQLPVIFERANQISK